MRSEPSSASSVSSRTRISGTISPTRCAAVERQFEIIGETLRGLKRADPSVASGIPDLARIIAFRNILIHGYASIDDQLVWGVVEADLPVLRRALETQLAAFPEPE